MRTFSIEGRAKSPAVFINESGRVVEISGNSTLKEANWFYSNVLKWILAFNTGSRKTQVIDIRLRQINDSSVKWILLILKKLESLIPAANFEINWYLTGGSRRAVMCARTLKSHSVFRVNLLSEQRDY
ncbi:MAG: SiaC family regulatory phosphoprotein [Bacteroidales bacterium]|jgi:hypothetical protein